ncbi:MAG: YbjQ family protein [Candidatus Aenigmarchaeota archaeon]|nr:YbjQ family protein [Candidatus Aenigmarchaeota archaeon]
MIITTTEAVEGSKIAKTLGLVKGNTIRAKWFGKDIIAGLRNIVGGELKEYTEMMSEAREQALKRMTEEAKKLGADAVISVRFTTSTVTGGAAELLAYGTAVKLKK